MRRSPISPAKISSPLLSDVLARPRLFRLLDRFAKQKLIWVMGPPGAGKTILVSSYLKSRQLKGCWYQIDSGDADPATFFYYLGLAAKQAAPRFRQPLPLLTPEYLPGLPDFSRRFFKTLSSRLTLPFALVFDNYQEVAFNSDLHQLLCEGIAQLPPGGRIIMISREVPPAVFARLKANREMAVIDWDALRFTEEETADIVALQSPERMSRKEIKLLHLRTEGWAAGMTLMLAWVRAKKKEWTNLERWALEVVFDYFAGEILEKLKPAEKEMLIQMAYLPRMTLRMAEQLTGRKMAGTLLSEMTNSHYFVQRHFGSELTYEFHALFREFLLSRAKEQFTEAELNQVQHRAAVLLEKAGQMEHAVDLYAKAHVQFFFNETKIKNLVSHFFNGSPVFFPSLPCLFFHLLQLV